MRFKSLIIGLPVTKLNLNLVDARNLITSGVWKRRKPESGIGTGMGTGTGTGTGTGNGTGTVMGRGTDTRTGTSFTLNYFNSNSVYTKK